MKKIIALIILILVAATGCASIMNTTRQDVIINTNESNSVIKIYDSNGTIISEGKGNLTARLKRAKDKFTEESYKVQITSPKGEVKEFGINSELSMWFPIGNFVFGGIPGWVIDGFSEAKYKLRTTDGVKKIKKQRLLLRK
jgi:uncharacterized protein YceK